VEYRTKPEASEDMPRKPLRSGEWVRMIASDGRAEDCTEMCAPVGARIAAPPAPRLRESRRHLASLNGPNPRFEPQSATTPE